MAQGAILNFLWHAWAAGALWYLSQYPEVQCDGHGCTGYW